MNVSLQGKQNGLTKNIHKNDKRSANSVIQKIRYKRVKQKTYKL